MVAVPWFAGWEGVLGGGVGVVMVPKGRKVVGERGRDCRWGGGEVVGIVGMGFERGRIRIER